MKLTNLNELFLHELKDVYDAEHQLVDALPKLAEAANDPELRAAFEHHLEQTRQHVARLEDVFAACGEEPDRETCKAMKGLISEGNKFRKEDGGPSVRDAALISAAQRVEHYEIAAYGTLITWARTAGIDAVSQLEATLAEEKAADEKLSTIAENCVNAEAEAASDDLDEGMQRSVRRPPAKDRVRSNPARPVRSRR